MTQKSTVQLLTILLFAVLATFGFGSDGYAAGMKGGPCPEEERFLARIGPGTGTISNVTISVQKTNNGTKGRYRVRIINHFRERVTVNLYVKVDCPDGVANRSMGRSGLDPGQDYIFSNSWCSPPGDTACPGVNFLWAEVKSSATGDCLGRAGTHPNISSWSGPCPGGGSGGGGSGGGGGGGGGGGTDSLSMIGNVGYQISGNQVRLQADAVRNTKSTTSGSLQLKLWATSTPFSGTSGISGYQLGVLNLSPLPANTEYANLNQWVTYNPPANGTYYIVMTLNEYNGAYYVVDYRNFSGTRSFPGGVGGGGGFIDKTDSLGCGPSAPTETSYVGDVLLLALMGLSLSRLSRGPARNSR